MGPGPRHVARGRFDFPGGVRYSCPVTHPTRGEHAGMAQGLRRVADRSPEGSPSLLQQEDQVDDESRQTRWRSGRVSLPQPHVLDYSTPGQITRRPVRVPGYPARPGAAIPAGGAAPRGDRLSPPLRHAAVPHRFPQRRHAPPPQPRAAAAAVGRGVERLPVGAAARRGAVAGPHPRRGPVPGAARARRARAAAAGAAPARRGGHGQAVAGRGPSRPGGPGAGAGHALRFGAG